MEMGEHEPDCKRFKREWEESWRKQYRHVIHDVKLLSRAEKWIRIGGRRGSRELFSLGHET
jgi:hypothetical protein